MMNFMLCAVTYAFGLMLVMEPFIDNRRWFLSQTDRLKFTHTLFSSRSWLLSFFQRSSNISSRHRAIQEIMQLHHPPFYLSHKPNETELNQFRLSAKQIFGSLYPQRNIKTCKIEPILFEHCGRQVRAYAVHDGHMYDWTHPSQKILLYMHGGGFVYGDIEIYSGYECYLSREYNMPVIHIEYGLAPENNISSAIDDVTTAYKSMLKYDPKIHERMIGMGDSSGGLLWLRLVQIMVEQEQPVPLALVLLSPWVDLSFIDIDHDSETVQKRVLFSLQLVLNLREQAFKIDQDLEVYNYFEEFTQELNKVNPKEHSFKGFPPMYVTVGTEELFLWDALLLKDKIIENDGLITLEQGHGLMHTYSMFHLWSSEAQCSQNKIRMFIEQF